ncbi:GTP-binding protein [bacterium]|nr:GTP-binding protein [bacterium]
MNRIENVPTNTLTGLLGVGKTSAILNLIDRKRPSEKWAILVNEFGDVPIDQTVFEERQIEGIGIREVAGGCLCCTAGVPLQVAITLLLREIAPDRLLIEMSGMGHPGGVLFSLREGRLSETLDMRATICLVDPRDVDEPSILHSQIFQDQVHMADLVIANKTDLADPEELEAFDTWSRELYPPKRLIAKTTQGQFDLDLLDVDSDPMKVPLFPELHQADEHPHHDRDNPAENSEPEHLEPGTPYRSINEGYGRYACGWIFSPKDVFDEEELLMALAEDDNLDRIKGAFRIGGDTILLNRAGNEIETRRTAYSRDSRVEIISRNAETDWDHLERALLACLKVRRTETEVRS